MAHGSSFDVLYDTCTLSFFYWYVVTNYSIKTEEVREEKLRQQCDYEMKILRLDTLDQIYYYSNLVAYFKSGHCLVFDEMSLT